MYELEEARVNCPYCGEVLDILLDPGEAGSSYTEDCQVCCRPILFSLTKTALGHLQVEGRREDE
jgi:hypothetical protein